jgi:hypothetical protein
MKTKESGMDLSGLTEDRVAKVGEYTGLTEDQVKRFIGCLSAVGLEIVSSAALAGKMKELTLMRFAALNLDSKLVQVATENIDFMAYDGATIREWMARAEAAEAALATAKVEGIRQAAKLGPERMEQIFGGWDIERDGDFLEGDKGYQRALKWYESAILALIPGESEAPNAD